MEILRCSLRISFEHAISPDESGHIIKIYTFYCKHMYKPNNTKFYKIVRIFRLITHAFAN